MSRGAESSRHDRFRPASTRILRESSTLVASIFLLGYMYMLNCKILRLLAAHHELDWQRSPAEAMALEASVHESCSATQQQPRVSPGCRQPPRAYLTLCNIFTSIIGDPGPTTISDERCTSRTMNLKRERKDFLKQRRKGSIDLKLEAHDRSTVPSIQLVDMRQG
jgi:hypothetical protein